MALAVDALDHLVLNVRDVEAAADWYQRVLGMRREDFDAGQGRGRRTALRFGRQKINLRPVSASQEQWITATREAAGSDDLCFLTAASPEAVVAHLKACDVAIVAGPAERQGALGTIVSVYCRDPDGSLIEISSYRA
jgi:catechol 2,3-dioxygenase-like lactoylglutathione lyase family enzyme